MDEVTCKWGRPFTKETVEPPGGEQDLKDKGKEQDVVDADPICQRESMMLRAL